MSEWFVTEDEDIEVGENGSVDIYVTNNEWGSVYKLLTFEQLEKIYMEAKNKKEENERPQ